VITLDINGKTRSLDADPEMPLPWPLRDHLPLSGEFTFRDGRIEQSSFHDHRILGVDQMPRVGAHTCRPASPAVAAAK